MESEYYKLLVETPWHAMEMKPDSANTEIASCLMQTIQEIEHRQRSIFDGNKRHARIYAGYLPSGLNDASSIASRKPFEATKAVVRSICDTATALMVRARPKADFVTDGADWEIQMQAEDADQFCVGAYQQAGLYPTAARCFHDSTVFGTGAWKYIPDNSKKNFLVRTDRILIDDLVVDEDECRETMEPENYYHCMRVRTDAVMRKYGSQDDKLSTAIRMGILATKEQGWATRRVGKGQCILVDAYHIDPSGQNHTRMLAVNGVVIKRESWPFPWAPFTFLWWAMPLTGFYGDGIAYRQFGRQERVSYMYRWVQRIHDMLATPTTYVDPVGGPPILQMSNEIGRIIATRKPPTFAPQAMVAPEVYRWLDNLERGGYEDEGISSDMAQNEIPAGVESAPAQRELSFKQGQRFAPVSQRYEDAVAVETATKLIAFYQHHCKSSGKRPTASYAGLNTLYNIELPDLDASAYCIRAAAASLESLSPAARTQSALELAQTGWISPSEGRALIGHPDLRESDELGNAAENYAKMVLHDLYRGKQVAVDTLADLSILDRVVRQGRLVAIQRHAKPAIVDNMARYLEEIDNEKQMQIAAMTPPTGPTGAAPTPADFPQGQRPRTTEPNKI